MARQSGEHSSIKITVDCYAHLASDADIAWVDRFDSETSSQTSANRTQTLDEEELVGSLDVPELIENIDDFGGPARIRTENQQIMSLLL